MSTELLPRPISLPVNLDQIPGALTYLNQWVLWRYVWKEGGNGKRGKWDKPPFQPNGKHASSTAALTWSTFKTTKKAYESGLKLPVEDPLHFDGVGFVPHAIGNFDLQIVFGDLDKCRDKETGAISTDALQDLQSINSYCEPSPSGTGLRFVAHGAPPFPPGKAGRKKGGIELYQGGHYLTITGQRLPEYPATIEKRPEELNAFYQKHFSQSESEQPKEGAQKGNGSKRTDEQVIALAAQAHNSPKFLSLMDGKYEHFLKGNGERLYPSQSEADLALCQLIAFYTPEPAQIDSIFRRSKLYREKWEREDYGKDTIKIALERTTDHYSGNVWNDSEAGTGPAIRTVTKDDLKSTIGVHPGTGAVNQVVEMEKDGQITKFLAWVSDCTVHIHTETRAKDDTEFIFVGTGAVDKRAVKFTLPASSLADSRKFKAALINAFGAKNRVGKLSFEMVQEISINPRLMERIETPAWNENIPLLPGVGLIENVEFRLSSKIPAAVYDGDLQAAKEILQKLLKVHKFAPILVASILGSPAITRWHKNDRFGLGLWGSTGTLKTSITLAALGIYGTGYLDGPKLKAGKGGSTTVGAMEVFAACGFLPQIYDDVKTVDSKDAQNYVAVIHSVLEGEEKARGKKDGGLRESRDFTCIPIVTGEVRPQEASTSARVLNLNWIRSDDKLLGEVQQSAALLPVIGYHWLRFLAETDFVLGKDFEAFRSKKMEEFLGLKYANPGRLATIHTLLVSVWDLLEASPMGGVFTEARESFKTALKEATTAQGQAVSEETEIERFLSGLEELLASNPGLIMGEDGKKVIVGSIIGKRTDRGLFLLPTQTLNELAKIRTFNQQPTIDSITQALHERGILIRGERDKLKTRMRIGVDRVYGWHITWAPVKEDLSPVGWDSKNDSNQRVVPVVPRVHGEDKRENFLGENSRSLVGPKNVFSNTPGTGGTEGTDKKINSIDRLVDSDFSSEVSVPGSVPFGKGVGDSVVNCGIGPHPRKEDPGPQRFKAKVQTRSKNICRLCGQHFEIPLSIAYQGGNICEPCRRDGPPSAPPKAVAQTIIGH